MESESITGVVFSEIDERATEALLAVDEEQPANVASNEGEARRVARKFPKKRYEAKKARERNRRAKK